MELTRALLERIESLNDRLHAYITVTADLALKQARTAENAIIAGDYRGPLYGWARRYFSRPFNLTGHPAMSICGGFTSSVLSAGFQIV